VRPATAPAAGDDFRPGGRSTIFRILLRHMLAAAGDRARAVVVSDDLGAVRVPRQLRGRVRTVLARAPHGYAERIATVAATRPDLLALDRLDAETAGRALAASASGLRVVAQIETPFAGAPVARQLLDLHVDPAHLSSLSWIVTVQRVTTLCPHCRQPAAPDAARLAELARRYPAVPLDGTFYRAGACPNCSGSGRTGEVLAFDVFRAGLGVPELFTRPSELSLHEYLLRLAAQGRLPLEDVLEPEAGQLRRTINLLSSSERALAESNAALERKVAELEAANQVLVQRTEALISLQGIARALISPRGLVDLGAQVCRHACELGGADRAILYTRRQDGAAEVLAASGWDERYVGLTLDAARVFTDDDARGGPPAPLNGWPPGMQARHPDVEGAALRAGLRVPLVAQGEPVGVMIVHSTRRTRFAPGEIALLETFANQAALAIQRAGLFEALHDKIAQLEAAQAELIEKGRMEHELELARQVQQSMLPRVFPQVPGYTFAGRGEPARQVGGDFYDVISLDGDTFGVVVADVADKGMPAALVMALTRSLLRAEARRAHSPRAALLSVHRLLCELGESSIFVTVFYGVIDGGAQRMRYVRAGHDRPLVLRGGRALPLGGEGMFLGLLDVELLGLTEEQIDLQAGDRLVLYSDGLIDTLAPDGETFGLKRLSALLETHAGLGADALCSATFAALAEYQGAAEQYDDMTMLVVEVAQ
jgi:serine phosphatase RsbU (regulator of sigma subunit)